MAGKFRRKKVAQETSSDGAQLTVLIDEHPDGNARHVKAVEKVLDRRLHPRLDEIVLRLLQLEDAVGHRLYHVSVPIADVNQCRAELRQVVGGWFRLLEVNHLLEALGVPVADKSDRIRP